MRKIFLKACAPVVLLCFSHAVNAQALATYADCVVHDVPSLQGAITRFLDSIDAEARPAVLLDQWLWNGQFSSTHRIIVNHQNYAALEAFRAEIFSNLASTMSAGNSLENAADCETDGLAILRGVWGTQQVDARYWQAYGVATSDAGGYAEALGELADSFADEPIVTVLFENRAGISGDTHLVAVGAESLAGLNEFLDEMFASDAFEDFADDVGETRRLTWRAQAFRMRTWAPDGN